MRTILYTAVFIMSILVLALASVQVQAGDAGCCCQGSIASPNTFVNREACTHAFIIPTSRQTCPEVCGQGSPQLNLSNANCNQPGYSPKLTSLEKLLVRGKRQVTLTWASDCTAEFYNVSRCESRNCNFKILGTTASNFFTDESDELLFDKEYTYRVAGYFRVQDKSIAISTNLTIGNVECMNRNTDDSFCIHKNYYSQYAPYLIGRLGFTQGNFNNEIINMFSTKFNKAFACNEENILSSPAINCNSGTQDCFTGQVCTCISDTQGPRCTLQQSCTNFTNNPFGLFSDKTKCEGTVSQYKYCFYDKSATIVNTCYSCNPNMECYDYKSKNACEGDNCRLGSCSWKDTIPSLGVGACINRNTENCNWCTQKGSQGSPTIGAYNAVFDICTPEKSQALSTDQAPCYFLQGESISCDQITCTDYSNQECLGFTSVRIDPATNAILSKSNDKCRIGVCSSVFGSCGKNADYGLERDCADEACELDYFPPDTIIVPTTFEEGIPTQFAIDITDKTEKIGSPRRVSLGYETKLCAPGLQSCADGSQFLLTTSASFLVVSNLKMFDGTRLLHTLAPGPNTLKFYTIDPAMNLGLIKSITFNASPNVSGPVVLDTKVSDGKSVKGTHYTKTRRPVINITFSDFTVITFSSFVGTNSTISFVATTLGNNTILSMVPSQDLTDGMYNITVSGRNEFGKLMKHPLRFSLVIDTVAPSLKATPINTTLRSATTPLQLNFTEEVFLEKVLINGIDLANKSPLGGKFHTLALNLSDGRKLVEVLASDYAGNKVHAAFEFVVNAVPTVIKLISPKTGVSKESLFNISVETDNDAICRYVLDLEGVAFPNMKQFTVSGAIIHTLSNFNEIAEGDQKEHKLVVSCDDDSADIRTKTFRVAVDKTPPIILAAFAQPSIIIESDLATTFKVQTDDNAVCKYGSTSKPFAQMESEFLDPEMYQKIHSQNYTATSERKEYSFFVACENEAGLLSNTSRIDFKIDLDVPLTIQVNTPLFTNTSTIPLDISTNKRAQCYFGRSQEAIAESFGDISYRHIRTIANTPLGVPQVFFTRCIVNGVFSSIVQIKVTADATPPAMLYVNDSSALPGEPEFTFLTDSLRVKWLGQDNETAVGFYRYSLESVQPRREIIINNSFITTPPDADFLIVRTDSKNQTLNLTDKAKYIFRVDATNIVGLTSKALESDGITVDISKKPGHCSNMVLDDDETDIDCGGSCIGCHENLTCKTNSDCESGFCNQGLKQQESKIPVPQNAGAFLGQCKQQSCSDAAKNGDETDIDCGGSCKNKCPEEKACIKNSDCQTAHCEFGACKKPSPCNNGLLDAGEGDIDCGAYCPSQCSVNRQCNVREDCIKGTQCTVSKCTLLEPDEDLDTIGDSTDNCPSSPNQDQADMDKDGLGDACDDDIDGDGLQNIWEDEHNLDKFAADSDGNGLQDGEEDFDNDELNNREEQRAQTDPYKEDTDADGHIDSIELDANTNPLDPKSYPSSNIFSYALYALALILIIGGLAVGYKKYGSRLTGLMAKKPASQPYKYTPAPAVQPKQLAKPKAADKHKLFELRMKEKLKTRTGLLNIFGSEAQAPDQKTSKAQEKSPEQMQKQLEKKSTGPSQAKAQAQKVEKSPEKQDKEQGQEPKHIKQPKIGKQDSFAKLDTLIKKRQKR